MPSRGFGRGGIAQERILDRFRGAVALEVGLRVGPVVEKGSKPAFFNHPPMSMGVAGAKDLAHHADELKGAGIGDTVEDPVGLLAGFEDSLVSENG